MQKSNMGNCCKTVLIFCDYYLPGFCGGGTVRSIENIVEAMGDEYKFKIITRNHDLGGGRYSQVDEENWEQIGKAEVRYLPDNWGSIVKIREIMNETKYDLLYLNSFFSMMYTVIPLLLRKMGIKSTVPVVLAPRGEFSVGALSIKCLKKRLFIKFANLFEVYKKVLWQASSEFEKQDIQQSMEEAEKIYVASDLPRFNKNIFDEPPVKEAGSLKVVFLARIAKVKNLKYALALLNRLNGKVEFSIYGPIEDLSYWEECLTLITSLPSNITVIYKGSVESDTVYRILAEHHLLLFPTLGENFGHVILEALQVGLPVIVSEHTPWKGIETMCAGRELSLANPQQFADALNDFVEMTDLQYRQYSASAKRLSEQFVQNEELLEQYRDMFMASMN